MVGDDAAALRIQTGDGEGVGAVSQPAVATLGVSRDGKHWHSIQHARDALLCERGGGEGGNKIARKLRQRDGSVCAGALMCLMCPLERVRYHHSVQKKKHGRRERGWGAGEGRPHTRSQWQRVRLAVRDDATVPTAPTIK